MPARAAPLRILCYAVNGLGLGHVTRLVAVCRQLRRLTTVLGIPAEILFVTSSEGDALAFQHGFATFKIPSKTLAQACRLDPHRYRKIARQWIWNAVNLISPDLLIVDTFPAGTFNELHGVLDLGTKNVFIYRAVRPEVAAEPWFRSALEGYDLILRPQEGPEERAEDEVPAGLRDRTATVGPMLLRSVSETYERDGARDQLGLPAGGQAVYVSTGGGGDREAEALLGELVAAFRGMPDVRFVVGAGLLYRGREWAAPNVAWTRRPVLVECFRAFDAAVTAGGFNTVWELMHCGVPCLFLARPRGWDDQEARAERCAAAGAGRLLTSREPDAVRAALSELLEPGERERCAAAARGLVPRNDALDAAEEILSLAVDRERVEAASLLVDPGALFAAEQAGIGEDDLLQASVRVAARATDAPDAGAAEAAVEAALSLLCGAAERGHATRRALAVLKKVEPCPTPESVAARALELLEHETEVSP